MTVLNAATAESLADPAFPVVGVGVGEGGLDAFQQLLHALPRDTGLAFVLVQQLKSIDLDAPLDLLQRTTLMPVMDIRGEPSIEPNHIYIVPAAQHVVIDGGVLKPLPRNDNESSPAPVDCFLESLAANWRRNAIGVVLSGTGKDGTLGLQAIRASGGLTFAQDGSARHDGMSRSAIDAGCVDFILPPGRIAEELQRISPHPDDSARIDLLRKITRRLVFQGAEGLPEYARLLERDPEQGKVLYQDVLLNVTGFFRDPGAFDVLCAKVFPQLVENRTQGEAVRLWVPGCSTGEEVYSLAIALIESIGGDAVPIRVFATDVDQGAIAKARAGRYPKSISEHVSPERLRRFFTEAYDAYQISQSVRDVCVFARQDVLTAPPFSRIDLVACRTLLMSFDPFLQRRVLPLLCHALRPSGVLVLGRFGTIGALADLFETVDARHRIYSRKRVTAPALASSLPTAIREHAGRPRRPQSSYGGGVDAPHGADGLVLANSARPGVLVNADLEIVQFRGDTSRYLTQPPGKPTSNLLRMARKGLLVGLRAAVQKALESGAAVREEGVRVHTNRTTHEVDLDVLPIRTGTSSQLSLLVMFEERNASADPEAKTASPTGMPEVASRREDQGNTARLMRELAATRDYLQSVINELETANGELQAANEEVLSVNEELHSINEELQSSREQIQASNEELSRLNEEMRQRNELLGRVNNDLANILASAHLALVVVGPDLRVRRFTSQAAKLLDLIPEDVGRPISELRLPFDFSDFDVRLTEVIESVAVQEHEVQDREGRWYSLRLRPCRSENDAVDGAVIVLVDIDAQKRIQGAIEESEQRFRLLADNAPVLIWTDGIQGREFVNRTYLDYLGVGERDVRGWNFIRSIHPDDRDGYVLAREEAVSRGGAFETKFRLRRADGEYRWVITMGVPRLTESGELLGYAGSTHDIDDLVRAQENLARSEESLETELAAMRWLQEMSGRLVQAGDTDSLMHEILDAAIAITAADMGHIQLRDRSSDVLRVVSSQGFRRPFLEFFAEAGHECPACGTAMHRGERVVVEDVTKSEIFAGTPALDVLLAAGVRGMQSTPLISRSGVLVGMLSTHYRTPTQPAGRDLGVHDLLARQAADAIERIQIEEARLEAASRSQQLLDVIPAGVYAVASSGVITNYNRQAVELWGRSPKPGDTDEGLWLAPTRDSPRRADMTPVKNALRSGTPTRGEEAIVERPDGSRIPVHINVDPVRDAAGLAAGAIVVFQDVTHLKRAEAALRADHRKDQFVAMLAHELRNPLAALRLTVELMRRDHHDAGVAADDLRLIDQHVANLARLVDDLLDVTRMRQGKINLLKAPLDLRSVVESAIQSIRPDADAKGLTMSVRLPGDSVYVDGDAARLEQAVVNLIDNAIKYTDTGGRVDVALAADAAQAVLYVQDTGIGVRPEMLPCIFDLFAQDDSSLTRSRGGLGIGLFMVAKLAEMHDGSVEAHSAGLGQGTEFRIRLPRLSPRQVRRLRARNAGAEAAPMLPVLRILVVEDNVDVANKLTALLQRDGHEVRLERDGLAAVAAVGEFQPSAVLLDIGLPVMDGYQVARQIRQQPGLENVVIVGLSGYTHEEAQRRAADAGFDELLGKPFDLNVLGTRLARLVVGDQ
jgi:two-component system CheB/CheR fusion protein